jgi:Arc/MetJ-type ribon-helix-helix transcriptional regulator
MKETISVRLDYDLIKALRLDEYPNKSDRLREVLREYVRMKETRAGLEEIKEQIRLIEERLTALEGKEECTRAVEDIKKTLSVVVKNQRTLYGRMEEIERLSVYAVYGIGLVVFIGIGTLLVELLK